MQNSAYSGYNTETTDLFLEEPHVYGGFWERFGAAFLDGLILAIPNYLMQYMIGEISGSLVSIVLSWLYYALQESGNGQATLGKKALGLKVISEDGQRISFGQATGRYFGKYISGIILLIGYFMMLWNDKRQTLHDKMAGTLVVKR
jgi:uncharacterized RDD family membrane protein YckC